jgi:hypothetical protein
MNTPSSHRTLIVANLTASTPILLQEVERRALERPTTFELLIPNVQSGKYADWSLETACSLLSRAAGRPVEGHMGSGDAFESISERVREGSYDDIVISTLPKGRSEWLRKDLPSRVEQLGVPVTVITPPEQPSPIKAFAESFSAKEPPAPRR